MKIIDYDAECDAITLDLGSNKIHRTLELTEHILVDITNNGTVVGFEILSASEQISKIFNRTVSKAEIKQLLCEIKKETDNEYLIQFNSPEKNEVANLLFPVYRSPLIS